MTRPAPPSSDPQPTWWLWLRRWWPGQAPEAAAVGAHADQPPPRSTPKHPVSRPGGARAARREQLYAVVRENMIRAGVLSGAYKFKVLTLDPQGLSHTVLIDIHPGALGGMPEGMGDLEINLRQLARERLSLEVRSVYWRLHGPKAVPRTGTSPPLGREPQPTDPLAALHQALQAGDPGPDRRSPRGFEPTRPMPRRHGDGFDPLSETQLGDLQ